MRRIPFLSEARRAAGRTMPAVALALAACAGLPGGTALAESRGELLYNTNCVACHNEKEARPC